MEKIIAERVDRWKKKLIDLGKRNRLISFRPTKVTTVRIVDEQPPEVFATLVTELKAMDFLPMPEKKEKEEDEGDGQMGHGLPDGDGPPLPVPGTIDEFDKLKIEGPDADE